jgi:PAS domain S-box-containing protein
MDPPSFFSVTFLGLILVMSATLVSEVVKASKLSREVESNERRWRSLLEKVKFLVAGLDHHGKINYVNPYYCEISGYPFDQVQGKHFTDLIPEKDRPFLIEQFTKAMQGKILPRSEVPFLTRDRSVRQTV